MEPASVGPRGRARDFLNELPAGRVGAYLSEKGGTSQPLPPAPAPKNPPPTGIFFRHLAVVNAAESARRNHGALEAIFGQPCSSAYTVRRATTLNGFATNCLTPPVGPDGVARIPRLGEEQNRCALEPVEVRHRDVKHQCVRLRNLAEHRPRFLCVACLVHRELPDESAYENRAEARIALGDEQDRNLLFWRDVGR